MFPNPSGMERHVLSSHPHLRPDSITTITCPHKQCRRTFRGPRKDNLLRHLRNPKFRRLHTMRS